MKTLLQKLLVIAIVITVYYPTQHTKAQCGAGFTASAINFDMQYLSPTLPYPASPLNFMAGKNSMRFAWSGANTFRAFNNEHTGQGTSFGTRNEMEFIVGAGADTMVFEQEVSNLRFSVYDLDLGQVLNVTAQNASGTAQTITMVRDTANGPVVVGSGTTSATGTGIATGVNLTARRGTVNITIAGPVRTVRLVFTKPSGGTDSIYISDILYCNNNSTTGVWPNGYQAVSTPEAGEPHFVLASYRDSIMVVDMVNNTSSLLYRDVALSASGINSLAVDPYRQVIYYSDNARSTTNTAIYRYNVRTGVRSVWIADVRTLGINLYAHGMGSGGASFYDGALFIGQDQSLLNNEPVTVYRIDIDPATGNPTKASRFWSWQGNNTVTSFMDWSDFVINNGILYNFNFTVTPAPRTSVMHFNMNMMDTIVGFTGTSRSQVSIDYQGNIYHMTNGNRELYNLAGGYGAPVSYTGTTGSNIIDAGESFKFPYDFGDAPLTYGVAYHLYRTTPNLMIGASVDYEVNDTIEPSAAGDDLIIPAMGALDDEEGVSTFPALTVANASYTVPVGTTNSSGAAATLYGYLDFNRDGDFADAGEQSAAASVPNGSTPATPINVTFTGLTGGSVGASYIRFRLATSAAEAANRFGRANTGEAEDFPIPILASSLPVELVDFTATAKENNTTQLDWSTASELNNDYFEVQRTQNNTWETIGTVDGNGNSNIFINYVFTDNTPYKGINYYRLKQVDFDGSIDYSPTVSVKFDDITKTGVTNNLVLFPNPAGNEMWIKAEQEISGDNALDLEVFNLTGEKLYVSKMQGNLQKIDMSTYQKGMYFIKVGTKTYRILKE